MCAPAPDRILNIYLCRSPQVSMFVFLYLEGSVRPRATARIEWGSGLVLFVEFPQLSLEALQERVRQDMEAFSAQYGARISRINIPDGCSPERLMEWIKLGNLFAGAWQTTRMGLA
jgi:hypothetical protein